MTVIACDQCRWHLYTPEDRRPDVCPHCRAATLSVLDETAPMQVEQHLPFSVALSEVRVRSAEFIRRVPFSPVDLNAENLMGRAEQIFLPRYLVDTDVSAEWQAQLGFNYEVLSHQEILEGGRWETVQRKETRERKEPRLGRLSRRYENAVAPALEDDAALSARLGDYSVHSSAVSGLPDFSGWIRLPERSLEDAWTDAANHVRLRAADECRRAAGADRVESFSWQPEFGERNWTLVLLPMLASYYLDDAGNPRRILLNGQTGTIFGEKRASEKRARQLAVTLAIAAFGLLAVGAVLTLLAVLLPLMGILALLFFLTGAAAGIGALFPVFIARRFNRQQDAQ